MFFFINKFLCRIVLIPSVINMQFKSIFDTNFMTSSTQKWNNFLVYLHSESHFYLFISHCTWLLTFLNREKKLKFLNRLEKEKRCEWKNVLRKNPLNILAQRSLRIWNHIDFESVCFVCFFFILLHAFIFSVLTVTCNGRKGFLQY